MQAAMYAPSSLWCSACNHKCAVSNDSSRYLAVFNSAPPPFSHPGRTTRRQLIQRVRALAPMELSGEGREGRAAPQLRLDDAADVG